MNIASIQVPNVASKLINSKEVPQEEGFSIVLSEILTVENESKEESSDIGNEQPKLIDDESDVVEENPLPIFLNISLYESVDPTLSLDKYNSMEDIVMADESISNNNVFQPHTYVIQDQVDLFTTDIDAVSKDSNVMINDNKIVVQEGFVPTHVDNSPDTEPKDEKLLNEKISTTERIIMGQRENKPIIQEEPKVIKAKEEESLITKDKDRDVQENKWTNNPIRDFGKSSFNSKISIEDPVLFVDNIQAVNDSIIELVETNTIGDSSIMKVRLNPEELGTVNITLKMEEGKLVAKILVDSDYVKQLFAGKINELSEGLSRQNINIEKIQIDLNTNLDHNLNSNSNAGRDFNQNTKKHYNQDQTIKFAKKPIIEVMTRSADIGLGKISILAWGR